MTTTLLSGLSDKSETIYWERFTEYVLVNPFLFNFSGLSGIAFLTLATETIAFFGKGDIAVALFYGSFLLGIVIIVILFAEDTAELKEIDDARKLINAYEINVVRIIQFMLE